MSATTFTASAKIPGTQSLCARELRKACDPPCDAMGLGPRRQPKTRRHGRRGADTANNALQRLRSSNRTGGQDSVCIRWLSRSGQASTAWISLMETNDVHL